MPRSLVLLIVSVLFLIQTAAATDRLETQREIFRNAHERIGLGLSVDMDELRDHLKGYPLLPYLIYADLLSDTGNLDADQVESFLDEYGDLRLSRSFRGQWLHELGAREDWAAYLRLHRGGGSATLRCYGLRARKAEQGVDDEWLRDARALWLVGHSQPSACDAVFATLYDGDALTAEQRWERITRAMYSGNASLASALRSRLAEPDQQWLDHWLALNRNPANALRSPDFETDSRRGRQLLRFGVRQLARSDRDTAQERLQSHVAQGHLPREMALELQREIALRAAYSRDEDALERLDGLPDAAVNDTVLEWTARVAVGNQDWSRVIAAVWDLPDDQRQRSEWQYWRAHALWLSGAKDRAEALFEPLSRTRNYYGFLAADALGRPYAMNEDIPERDPAQQEALAQRPEMQRARELREVGLLAEARREWEAALAGADLDTRGQAAMLALGWGWYDRAIHNANQAGLHNALALRFPVGFRDVLEPAAEAADVDPALVYALARKESAFSPDARSRVGARGLMQVMPETGRRVADRLGLSESVAGDLFEPGVNARLGTTYLAQVLERFDGNVILAAAAYNAGPERAAKWLEDNPGQPAAVWIENITYGETRDYVKSLLAFRAVFDRQLRGEPRRLAGVMPVMPGGEASELVLRDDADGGG